MTSAWDTAGMLPVRPPDDLDDHDVVVTDRGTYWECGLSDWHLMLGWFAGPDTLMRCPDDRERWWTVIEEDAAGNRRVSRQPAGPDDEIDDFLRERGIPEPPRGFRWFQLVPPGGTGRDVVAAYIRVQNQMPDRYDAALETAYTRAAVEELYGLPVTPPPPIPPEAWEPVPVDPRRRAEEARWAELTTGPPGAVPVLRCRELARAVRFYAALGFRAEELSGYAVLRDGTTELHLSETSSATPGACLVRVPDAAALWRRLQGRETLGRLEDDNPGMVSFRILDPDHNHLTFVSAR